MSIDQSEQTENRGNNPLPDPFQENLALAEYIGDIPTTQQLVGATLER